MVEYRTEDTYGEGYRNITDVLEFEIFELNNFDILEYCIEHYNLSDDILEEINEVIDDDFKDTEDVFIKDFVSALKTATGKNLQYVLWLTDKQSVIDIYNGENIDAYETSDIILSDLGSDGRLYAYEDMPKPIENN